MRLDIEKPTHGWLTVRLTDPGVSLEFDASYTPSDSVGDLARAAAGLLARMHDQVVAWNTEPIVYEFRFVTAVGRTRLEVYEFPNTGRVQRDRAPIAVIEEESQAMARSIWRGLRRLGSEQSDDEFAVAWGYGFPTAAVERLGQDLRCQAGKKLE